MSTQIGIFPGTFDPVHKGHIAFCIKAIELCHLDRLLILPEKKPRYKGDVSDITDRVTMLEIATKGIAEIEVLTLESSPFTVKETLAELDKYLGKELLSKGHVTLLVGADVLHSMHLWSDIDQLLSLMSLAIGIRSNTLEEGTVDTDLQEIRQVTKLPVATQIIRTDYAHVTSSKSRIERGLWNEDLDPGVLAHIVKRHLYG